MATTSTKRRSSSARRARPETPKNGRAAASKKASPVRKAKETSKNGRSAAGKTASPVRKAKQAVTPDVGSAKSKIVRKVAAKAAKKMALKSLRAAAGALRLATDRTASAGRNALEAGISRRLPIQVSIDVAVPLQFAWKEWMEFGSIPEGVHRIEDVEREGDSLFGRLAGPRSTDWEAEIVDEREEQSFAWRSVEGTDTAGLVTFHRLSDRLTRIELGLDVLPSNPAEALTMASHMAQRRAQADLRRFKAHVEFISPDVYESKKGQDSSAG
jgi:uncharacterized membrane protein